MNQPKIPVVYQAPIADRNTFLAPLRTPEVQAMIRAAGVDTPRVTHYTVDRLLRLYLFAALLPGLFHSLRGITALKDNLPCRLFVGLSSWSLQGLSDANHRISFGVFQQLYTHLSAQIRSRFSWPHVANHFGAFKIFDCTHFQLALKLMPWGVMQNQRAHKGQLKCALRLDGVAWVPDLINLDAQIHNDNTHVASLIEWTSRGFTYLFDRGFRKLAILVKLQETGNFFITRLHQGTHVTVRKERVCEPLCQGTLTIRHDQCVSLGSGTRKTPPVFRLLTVTSAAGDDQTPLYFLTNRFDLDPFEVAAIYRYRWQIELFFRWLKSSLKIAHFFSYSENGVYLQLYVTLIVHLLLLHYHRQQGLRGQLGIGTQRHAFHPFCLTLLGLGFRMGLWVATLPRAPSFSPVTSHDIVTVDLFTPS